MARGEFTAAVRHYGTAVEADAGSALLRNKRAAASAALGLHRNALRDLDTALELDPGSVQSRLQRCAAAHIRPGALRSAKLLRGKRRVALRNRCCVEIITYSGRPGRSG